MFATTYFSQGGVIWRIDDMDQRDMIEYLKRIEKQRLAESAEMDRATRRIPRPR